MIIKRPSKISEIKAKAKELKSEQDVNDLRELMEDEVLDIICNSCGLSCKTDSNYEGLIEAIIPGGFDSKVIGDERSIRFSLCEDCLSPILARFKVPPATCDHSQNEYEFTQPEALPQRETKIITLIHSRSKKT